MIRSLTPPLCQLVKRMVLITDPPHVVFLKVKVPLESSEGHLARGNP